MVDIADEPVSAVQRTLRFVPVGRFDLRSKEDIFATVTCEIIDDANKGIIGGRWRFRLSGFLKPRITAIDAKTNTTVATFKTLWDGEGYVELSDGRIFYWLKNRNTPDLWEFIDDRGLSLIKFFLHKSPEPLQMYEAHVEVESSAHALPETSLLAAYGWYLTKLMAEDRS